jgi:lipopolysaccharide/colanic/teichoic acid biosynthesis glycosyltransferase
MERCFLQEGPLHKVFESDMGIAMPGVRSSNPSIPAVTGTFDPTLIRSRYRDWGSVGAQSTVANSEWARRVLHFLLALIAIIITLPVMFLIAVLVRLTSKGPVLYTQVRVGLDRRMPLAGSLNHRRERDLGGRPFTIYKFRTMWVDAEHASGAVWAQQSDPRVTPIGRLLRQYRLDELPQLFNVLKGEMNIVGPRPERPTIFAELREHIAEYPLRQRAKPGITGLAQINHHYDRSLEDVRTKVHYDLEYIRRQSVTEDLRIMLKTVPVILLRRGGW